MNHHVAKQLLRRIPLLALALAVAVIGALTLGSPQRSTAQSAVTPIPRAGNPTCGDLDGQYADPGTTWIELKIEPVLDGPYTDGTLSVTIDVRDTAGGPVVDWTSNLGVDAVFVKGGPNGNLYLYDPPGPESLGDTGLHAPVNPQTNKYFGLSHLSFCYDLELDVSKDAHPSLTRTYDWEVEKDVTPAQWDMFAGDSGTSDYTVTVTKTGFTDSDWAVDGTITIHNPSQSVGATVAGVSDEISGVGAVAVDCGASFPIPLAAGATLECTYSSDLPDGADRVNTATVTTSGPIAGGSATADIDFDDATITEVNASVSLDDTFAGDLGTFSDTGSVSYFRTFTCNDDEGQHDNTATISDGDGNPLDSDSASVTVNCYVLAVSKDADATFNRTLTYDWTIAKVADPTHLELEIDESALVTYDVTVSAALLSQQDSGFAVSGTITIANPAPIDATLTAITDIVSPDIAAGVVCPSMTVPAGGNLQCTYQANLPDAASRTNTATATQQNYDYASDLSATPAGTTDYSGSADVVFGDPATIEEIDECADVSDSLAGFLGQLCIGDAPFTFEYQRQVGPYAECGDFTVNNSATVVATDTQATDEASASVSVHVPCPVEVGCTPGFWKNNLTKKGASQWVYGISPTDIVPGTSYTFAEAIQLTGRNVYFAHLAAAYLNLAAFGGDYPLTAGEIASASLADLTAANESGCPLSQ